MSCDTSAPTLLHLFTSRVASDAERPALWAKRDGAFRPRTWNAVAEDVRRTAAALASVGVRAGDRVVQVSENRPEWIVTDLAIQWIGAVHVPMHAPLAGPQIAEQIIDCEARVVVVSGAGQFEKLAALRDKLPRDLVILSYDACGDVRQIVQVAEEASAADKSKVQEPLYGRPDDSVTILYTSGTTGEPKGVMLSQRNLTSNTIGSLKACDMRPDDVRLTMLPLSHIFARTCDLYGWIASGCQLALAESRETVLADCAAVRPTLLNGVPYFFDKVMRLLVDQRRADEPGSLLTMLGGRVRFCCSGGAALPDHVARFYNERGVTLVQGYGLTETSPVVTLSTPEMNKVGCVGRPLEDVEVRIAADGEILTRGPHVMLGYWRKPEATAAVLRDGWFSTGDVGEIDADGFLRITGRKKELIVTAAGKNIAPVQLESLLGEDPLVHQAMVIGDGRNYLVALIVPGPDALKFEIMTRRIPVTNAAEALAHPAVRQLYTERIAQRLARVSHYEQVQKFALLDRPFTIESGELTPTLKLRREVIAAHFADEIRRMYE